MESIYVLCKCCCHYTDVGVINHVWVMLLGISIIKKMGRDKLIPAVLDLREFFHEFLLVLKQRWEVHVLNTCYRFKDTANILCVLYRNSVSMKFPLLRSAKASLYYVWKSRQFSCKVGIRRDNCFWVVGLFVGRVYWKLEPLFRRSITVSGLSLCFSGSFKSL